MLTEEQQRQLRRSIRIQKICSTITIISAIGSALITICLVLSAIYFH